MKVEIRPVARKQDEQVLIDCVEVTQDIKEIEAYALSKGTMLSGYIGERLHSFSLSNVYYFEAVDERCFAYTMQQVFEVKARLYVLEEAYQSKFFVRCPKSVLINLMQLESISPALNGRFTAHMKNSEKVMITRQYAALVKKAVLEGARNEL